MKKYDINKQNFTLGIGWIFGIIIGLILFSLSFFLIEEIGFVIGISFGLGFGTTLGIIIEYNDYKQLPQDQLREKKHLLFSSLLLIIFGLLMITYVLFN